MNVFELRDRLVRDYGDFTRSFVEVRDPDIRAFVDGELDSGLLWPEPLVQLNPSFEPGGWVDELVDQGLLHEMCRRIFRRKERDPETQLVGIDPETGLPGRKLRLHRHQVDALAVAKTKKPYVVTTGTGSGKSLTYIIPIVDHVIRRGPGQGIQAIVVYPMNALANSQAGELEKFLNLGFPDDKGPVRYRRYTGQESDQEREDIIASPPDILLTNYMMLELILTRPWDRQLIKHAAGLQFLVLDELHTYRGRQGADVALLTRRVREATKSPQLQCVGTSATLAGAGSLAQQQAEIAGVASGLFGTTVEPSSVIGETLRRATEAPRPEDPDWRRRLREAAQHAAHAAWSPTAREFPTDPLASWVESSLGITVDNESGRLVRAAPRSISEAAVELSRLTEWNTGAMEYAIKQVLDVGRELLAHESPYPVFPFRVHQFFNRGDAVHASIDGDTQRPRHLTTQGQQFVPGDRSRVLLPIAFCRECGQDYAIATAAGPKGARSFVPRDLLERIDDDDTEAGYLYLDADPNWADADAAIAAGLMPDDWLEEAPDGTIRVRSSERKYLPERVHISADGTEGGADVQPAYFIAGSFRLCLRCGVYYVGRQSDAGKLTTLGSGGRSTATSLLGLSTIKALREVPEMDLDASARKLLSFTDNRQDASLQAGHFNDFVEVGLLRAALLRAVSAAGPGGLRHDDLAEKVVEQMGLEPAQYAQNPEVKYGYAKEERDQALRDVIGYRLYVDLRRGWRVTSPNLEQCGLLDITYRGLDQLARDESAWQSRHAALRVATGEQREVIARTLLDLLRRDLVIHTDQLRVAWQDGMKARSSQHLIPPWAVDEQERLEKASIALPRSSSGGAGQFGGFATYISGRGRFGQFLRRSGVLPELDHKLRADETEKIILDLFEVLRDADLLYIVAEADARQDVAYQLKADAMRWIAGDGAEAYHDPIRVPRKPEGGLRPNAYFQRFYRDEAAGTAGIMAHEHTAQVPAETREEREKDFRAGRLPVLFCSPTMELGVDIADLNVVNMRNVPPTPANYAQRSGRAGRSGSPALVYNYCTTGSPHDQYYFRRPERMVAGQVRPPRIDLQNEDLVRAHVHAIWLTETGQSLHGSLADLLDLEDPEHGYPLKPDLMIGVSDELARHRAKKEATAALTTIEGLSDADWYDAGWLDKVLDSVVLSFDRACDRWRELYKSAHETLDVQNGIIKQPYRTEPEKRRARAIRDEAEAQLGLLTGTSGRDRVNSDFYSYRYFASEGFLPGYSFPRLPVSAYIPGRRGAARRDEYLSRPRFLAISEFGPRAIVYHEGSRYVINRVLLPASARGEDNRLITHRAKRCESCGYLHMLQGDEPGPDLCTRCQTPLPAATTDLFRMTNVATKRRDRINSDEEDRQRQGYELWTGVRFSESGAGRERTAIARSVDGSEAAALSYGTAATIWRMNVGWRRQRDGKRGFTIDAETGTWGRSGEDPTDPEDPMGKLTQRVIPFVEDRRNSLLLEPSVPMDVGQMATLGAALKRAIEVRYQLEDNELAAEPLPSDKKRNVLLFFEAAEGGAGVLGRLVRESDALADVASTALGLCHYDPATGDDLRRAPNASEDCEAACYDCLMSYSNQRDHLLLDRTRIFELLRDLAAGTVDASPTYAPREEHLERLGRAAESSLEEAWLADVERRGLALPDRAQVYLEELQVRPDYVYSDHQVAVFVDGPVHAQATVAERDAAAQRRLEDGGWYVIRFGADPSTWLAVFDANPSIFGKRR